MRAGRQDHYEVLGLYPDAPDEAIRAAYRALAARYHPDRNPGNDDAELQFKRINAAFRVLGDPERRRQYDELTQSPDAGSTEPATATDADAGLVRANHVPITRDSRVADKSRFVTASRVVGGLFVIVLVGAGGVLWHGRSEPDEFAAEQAAVTVEANYDPATCGQDKPISVVIKNGSKRTLKSVVFALHAFENGRWDDLALDADNLQSHAVVQPGGVSKTCWRAPPLKRPTTVSFRAEKDPFLATFYGPNELIPQGDR